MKTMSIAIHKTKMKIKFNVTKLRNRKWILITKQRSPSVRISDKYLKFSTKLLSTLIKLCTLTKSVNIINVETQLNKQIQPFAKC